LTYNVDNIAFSVAISSVNSRNISAIWRWCRVQGY
jgi:hypothetical protein